MQANLANIIQSFEITHSNRFFLKIKLSLRQISFLAYSFMAVTINQWSCASEFIHNNASQINLCIKLEILFVNQRLQSYLLCEVWGYIRQVSYRQNLYVLYIHTYIHTYNNLTIIIAPNRPAGLKIDAHDQEGTTSLQFHTIHAANL